MQEWGGEWRGGSAAARKHHSWAPVALSIASPGVEEAGGRVMNSASGSLALTSPSLQYVRLLFTPRKDVLLVATLNLNRVFIMEWLLHRKG